MQALVDVTVPILTFLMLAAVGLDLTLEDFARVRRERGLVLTGLAAPPILLPPVAVALTWLFRPDPDVAAGMALVAICPIGGISNTYSYLARAATALSVTLTALSCLLAVVTVPLLGRALPQAFTQGLDLTLPVVPFVVQLLLMLALPVGLGMWLRHRRADLAVRFRPTLQNLAFAGVAIVLALIILNDPGAFVRGLATTVPLAAVFVACSVAVGWVTGSVVTADPRNRFTFAAEFGTRNLGVAMTVAVTILGRVEFARFAYTYFLVEIPLMLGAIALFRKVQGVQGVQEVHKVQEVQEFNRFSS